jgi:hypothetical protein
LDAIVTLNDTSSVSRNKATVDGGGIYNILEGVGMTTGRALTTIGPDAIVDLKGKSSVSKNKANNNGGGIYNVVQGAAAGRVLGAVPDAIVTLYDDSSVSRNKATSGGGIYNDLGTLNNAIAGAGGNVYANTPDNVVSPI